MTVHLVPKTTLGKWSVALIVPFVVLLISFQLLVASGQRGGDTFFSNLTLTIPILLAGISGVLAFLTGIISIIRSRERSVPVFLATTIGFFVLTFCLAEVLFPH
jgi:hypothetical protein